MNLKYEEGCGANFVSVGIGSEKLPILIVIYALGLRSDIWRGS